MGIIRLDDAYALFEHRIWERALAYYDAGRAGRLTQIAPNLWHARVDGSFVYDVDIRLRHGRLVSAACTCPYAQQHAYCKHVGAVLLALNDMDESNVGGEEDADGDGGECIFPRDASKAVAAYWRTELRFSKRKQGAGVLGDDDWRAVRRILELLYGMPDIGDCVHMLNMQRQFSDFPDFDTKSTVNMRLLTPMFRCGSVDELPHGWLTVLEAAYEHLHDAEGLRALYSLYILLSRTYPEAVYVPRLRVISAAHWLEDREAIVECMNDDKLEMLLNDNPAYERILREDRLTEAAEVYCRFSPVNDRSLRLLDLLAETDPEGTRRRYVKLLQQPDSTFYKDDTAQQAKRVSAWVRRLEDVYGEKTSAPLARHILDMFPSREHLQHELAEYRTCESREGDDE